MITKEIIEETRLGELKNFYRYATGASIDTRILKKGDIFFALVGENTDGHNFISDAFENGASLCVVSKLWFEKNKDRFKSMPFWIVDDPLKAMQTLSKFYLKRFDIPRLAITGTAGKTTCRKFIFTVLSTKYNVHTTIGNYNNHIGMPLSILSLNRNHQISIVEIGTNKPGEIAYLCDILKPTHGLITNIGYGHIEFFGSKKGVAEEKGSLFKILPESGIAYVNMDDPYIVRIDTSAKKITYGIKRKKCDYHATILEFDNFGRATIKLNSHIIKIATPGRFSVYNALTAYTVAKSFTIEDEAIIEALSKLEPDPQRFNITDFNGIKIIDDTYNANPDSTSASIETLNLMNTGGKKIFIFGDMLELGKHSIKAHKSIGTQISRSNIDEFYCTGNLAYHSYLRAKELGFKKAYHYENKIELANAVIKNIKKGDLILIKGSRGSKMEEIIEYIMKGV